MRTLRLALLLAAVALAACGDNDDRADEPSAAQPDTDSESLEHIHGLGVDPRSGTLYLATHTGLFQAPKGQQQPRRVGDSEQDIMGFSVVGPDRFVGSGHPDPDETGSPPNLGLIESRDGGRTWTNVSLLGQADFHVLRSSGRRVYGFDGTQGRLMVSDDGGRRWARRTLPAAIFDLVIDPRDANRVVASTEAGVFSSTNAGTGWRRLRNDIAGLLAWPRPDALYLVDGRGQVQRSSNGGRQWRPTGSIGGPPAAFMAHERELYAALHDGAVERSTDAGASWAVRTVP